MALMRREQAELRSLNTFGVAARARELITLTDVTDADVALEQLARAPAQLILGGGSNILFSSDFEGTVLRVALSGRRVIGPLDSDDGILVEAAAGELWHDFVQWTLSQGLFGLENLSLIPGSVGASPVQNIGAYGVEIRDRLHSIDASEVRRGRRRTFQADECGLDYRESIFRRGLQSAWLLTAIRFRLARVPQLRLDYADLREELARKGTLTHPQALHVAQAVCAIRQRKLPDPAKLGNAGSFFRNPIVEPPQADALASRFPGIPLRPESAGSARCKLPAAWLIEQCGWKGKRRGDAGVAAQHALVLVNHGLATGRELLTLAGDIQDSVEQRFGIRLQPEVVIV